LFAKLSPESLIEKIKKFEALDKEKILKMKKQARKTAENFSKENFKLNILNFIKKNYSFYK